MLHYFTGIDLVFFNCLFLSSSKIEKFSVCDSRYDGKFSSILLLVNLQLSPYLNHGGSGAVEPLRNSFTCNLSSTCIQAVTSGTWNSFKMTWPSLFGIKITLWTVWLSNNFQTNNVVVPFKFIILIFLKNTGDFLGRDTVYVDDVFVDGG